MYDKKLILSFLKNYPEVQDWIQEDSLESWEKVYKKSNNNSLIGWNFEKNGTGNFTEFLLTCNIDPLKKLNKVPLNFLCDSEIKKSIIIPNNVTTIGMDAFRNCKNIQNIKLSDTIERIEYGAFSECENLKFIYLPDSLKFIGDEVFYGCKCDIIWGNNPQIEDLHGAFSGYDGIELEIPKSAKNLESIPRKLEKLTLYSSTNFDAESLCNYYKSLKEFNYVGTVQQCLKNIKNNKRFIKQNTKLKEIKCLDGDIKL